MAIDPVTRAMTRRIVTVYDCPQLGLFFITGQPTGEQRFDGLGERMAGIVCTPYRRLDAEQRAALTASAAPLGESHVDITANAQSGQLEFYDRLTKVTSFFPLRDLDPVVRERLSLAPRAPFGGTSPS